MAAVVAAIPNVPLVTASVAVLILLEVEEKSVYCNELWAAPVSVACPQLTVNPVGVTLLNERDVPGVMGPLGMVVVVVPLDELGEESEELEDPDPGHPALTRTKRPRTEIVMICLSM